MRLADRRALLQGSHLSRVQAFALDLVMVAEARDRGKAAVEQFKMAVLSADPGHFLPLIYPELSAKTDDDITEDDLVESQGEWKFETTDFDPTQADALTAALLADKTITVRADDIPDDDW